MKSKKNSIKKQTKNLYPGTIKRVRPNNPSSLELGVGSLSTLMSVHCGIDEKRKHQRR